MAIDKAALKTLVLASSRTAQDAPAEIAAGLRPRLDYLELAAALGGDVLDTRVDEEQPAWRRRMETALSSDLRQAQIAWSRRGLYDVWLSTSEKVGLPLALHGPAGRDSISHVMIAHNLSSTRKRQLHQLTGVLRRGFSDIICLSSAQERYLLDEVCLPSRSVHRLNDNIDTQFFQPLPVPDGGYLLAVGRENRDYATLVAAASLLKLPLTIVASSLWAIRGGELAEEALPPFVTRRREFLSYRALRDLYAGARLVIVPLHESSYAAGINGLMEAMAMGRPTVVSQTQGLQDYLGNDDALQSVPPADPEALAQMVRSLWEDEASLRAMGQAARAVAEREFRMERYVDGVAAVVRRAVEENK